MSLKTQSVQDAIEEVIMAMAFSFNTFRKTHKAPSHALLNMGIFWQPVVGFSHRKLKEISDQSVISTFENIALGGKKKRYWLSPPKMINTAAMSRGSRMIHSVR